MNPIKYARQQPALAAARVVNLAVTVLLPVVLAYVVARLAISRLVVRAEQAVANADWSVSWACVILSLLIYLTLVAVYLLADAVAPTILPSLRDIPSL